MKCIVIYAVHYYHYENIAYENILVKFWNNISVSTQLIRMHDEKLSIVSVCMILIISFLIFFNSLVINLSLSNNYNQINLTRKLHPFRNNFKSF